MEISQFLAKFLGLYIFLMALPLLISPHVIRGRYESFLSDDAVMKLAGIVTVLLGSFLVILHNVWVLDWRLLVTLTSWVVLIEGITIVYFPAHSRSIFRRLAQKVPMIISGSIGLTISLILIFMGFFQHMPAA
jgi:hypothetical protein